jgi:hypothetical protein
MKALLAVLSGFIMVLSLLGAKATEMTQRTPAQDSSRREAERLWEQAIAAKGGRARLYAVRNMVVSWRGNKHVDFYVFPNKLWRWMDDRPSPIGLAVEMHNLERNLAYLTYPDDPESPRRIDTERGRGALRNAQIYYLLETQWMKPVPVGVTSGRVEWRAVDVVQTVVDGTRVDFYLDRESHLPLKISFGTYYVTFSDYREVDDIQMPRRVSYMGSGWILTNYQLNVAYDEAIFERPPSIEAGPEAWRRR